MFHYFIKSLYIQTALLLPNHSEATLHEKGTWRRWKEGVRSFVIKSWCLARLTVRVARVYGKVAVLWRATERVDDVRGWNVRVDDVERGLRNNCRTILIDSDTPIGPHLQTIS
jgi:hypothetical protein